MRPPLLVLISAYAVAVVGLTLMPGQDDQGAPWRMDFFHAFYVITYTAPTIGFGEIPYEFSGAQRLWVTISIYITVLAWLYAVGTLISLIQDPAFRSAVKQSRLRRAVRRMSEPFYLICGYGDTGALLVRALTERRRRVVVVDHAQEAIASLELRDLGMDVPGFQLNAEIPGNLSAAGLEHRWCAGVVAVMDDDHANLMVAVATKLQSPSTTMIARSGNNETAANMASFGTDAVVDAYHGFADRLILAIHSPDMHRIQDWLTGIPATELPHRPQPPEGAWIICGFGRLGRAVYGALRRNGVDAIIVDDAPEANGCPPDTIRGKGTEAHTLRRAGIESASGLLAATADDADNLSIVITAQQLNSALYIAARENSLANKPLFQEADIELTVEPSYILASSILSRLNAPLLEEFLKHARSRDAQWHATLAERIEGVAGANVPETWTLRISSTRCPAVTEALEQGLEVTLAGITHHPRDRDRPLDCIPLMLVRADDSILLPAPETVLASGDRILFCGTDRALSAMRTPLHHINNLRYMLTGETRADGLIWRYLARRHSQ